MKSPYSLSDGERYPHRWGFTDTRFEFDDSGAVWVTGDRYPLCGYSMPHFIPFAEGVLGGPIRPEDAAVEIQEKVVPEPRITDGFLDSIMCGQPWLWRGHWSWTQLRPWSLGRRTAPCWTWA